MSDSERSNGLLPVGGILFGLAMIAGVIWYRPTLESHRPNEIPPFAREPFGGEDVAARMWHDPLQLVHAHRESARDQSVGGQSTEDAHHSIDRLESQIQHQLFHKIDQLRRENRASSSDSPPYLSIEQLHELLSDVMILPVMIPGSTYSEDVETRLRMRQAIVSALAVKGYVPNTADRIGFVTTSWSSQGTPVLQSQHALDQNVSPSNKESNTSIAEEQGLARGSKQSLAEAVNVVIPFEWFRRDLLRAQGEIGKYDSVLIMWLDEDAFREQPIDKLSQLVEHLLAGPITRYELESYLGRDQDSGTSANQADSDNRTKETASSGNRLLESLEVRLIGPATSTTLFNMLSPQDTVTSIGDAQLLMYADVRFEVAIIQARFQLLRFQEIAADFQSEMDELQELLAPLKSFDAEKTEHPDVILGIKEWINSLPANGDFIDARIEEIKSYVDTDAARGSTMDDVFIAALNESIEHVSRTRDLADSIIERCNALIILIDEQQPKPPSDQQVSAITTNAIQDENSLREIASTFADAKPKIDPDLTEIIFQLEEIRNEFGSLQRQAVIQTFVDFLENAVKPVYVSNQDWARTVVGNWLPPDYTRRGTIADPEKLRDLVSDLDNYFYQGLPQNIDPDNLAKELRDIAQQNPAFLVYKRYLDIRRELPIMLSIEFSDRIGIGPEWFEPLVIQWLERDFDKIFDLDRNRSSRSGASERLALLIAKELEYLPTSTIDQDLIEEMVENYLKAAAKAGWETGIVRYRDRILDQLVIYSNRSTAAEPLLLRDQDLVDQQPWSKSISDIIEETHNAKFVSTVVRDDDLAMAMCEELQRRGVDLIGGSDHIVLISEWDTFYGRALPFAFEATIQHLRGAESAGWSLGGTLGLMLEGDVQTPPGVHRFSYLRGIDGYTPNDADASTSDSETDGEASSMLYENDGGLEKPVGRSSLDYIRRVAVSLERLEEQLSDKRERVAAIGVLGSDVYDKLLVLQALRSRFPNAVFFTTDLDARMAHPDNYPFTRNTIIASSYGLRLNDQLQQNIPPFRDSYQTSTFMACLLALGTIEIDVSDRSRNQYSEDHLIKLSDEEIGAADDVVRRIQIESTDPEFTNESLDRYLKPQLYEIARSEAYGITPDVYQTAIHPPPRIGRPSGTMIFRTTFIGIATVLLVIPMSPMLRRYFLARNTFNRAERKWINHFTLFAVVMAILFSIAVYWDGAHGTGEPFEWNEGISIWPTEACRLAVILVTLVLCGIGFKSIKENNDRLETNYIFLPGEDRPRSPSFWRRWKLARLNMIRGWQAEADLRNADNENADNENADNDNADGVNQANAARRWIPFRRLRDEQKCFWTVRKQISINVWSHERLEATADLDNDVAPESSAKDIWNRYITLGEESNRLVRIMPITLAYLFFAASITLMFEQARSPYRGSVVAGVDAVLGPLSLASLIVLTFFVVDSTRLCEQFIRSLASTKTQVPATPTMLSIAEARGLNLADLSEYLDMKIIASRTETIGRLILFPFIVFFIIIISRLRYFDDWKISMQIVLILGVLLMYAIICAFVLRRAAEAQRRQAISHLRQLASKARAAGTARSGARSEQLRLLIDEIQNFRQGAFAPLSQHPIIRAIAIPFGGVGALATFDLLATMVV